MKNKKLTRTCIGCKAKKDKKELIRIVKIGSNEVIVDFEQRLEGRGAYICKEIECFKKVEKGNKLRIALRTNIQNKKYEELRGVIFGSHN